MPDVWQTPMLEAFVPTPVLVLLAFEQWNDVLKLPPPNPSLALTNAVWHFSRGMAQANLGKTEAAAEEQLAWQRIVAGIPADQMYDMLNTTGAVFKVHQNLLFGAIAQSRHDDKGAIEFFKHAVAAEEALGYNEPPSWFPPIRPMLGRLLLANRQLAEAEAVFRADLEKNPRDARALAGLRDCLSAQGHAYEAEQIDQQYQAVWKVAKPRGGKTARR
jgi:tetratricopeptide (TPR) repeat protein